jgi:hypothetical protein
VGKKLDADQFANYAGQQIRAAYAVLRHHQPHPFGLCACGRPQPCTVAGAWQATVDDFSAKLALLEATQPLPPVPPCDPRPQQASPNHAPETGRHRANQ